MPTAPHCRRALHFYEEVGVGWWLVRTARVGIQEADSLCMWAAKWCLLETWGRKDCGGMEWLAQTQQQTLCAMAVGPAGMVGGYHRCRWQKSPFSAKKLSKLWFLWSFHLFGPSVRWRVGPMWGVRQAWIGWELFLITFAPYNVCVYCETKMQQGATYIGNAQTHFQSESVHHPIGPARTPFIFQPDVSQLRPHGPHVGRWPPTIRPHADRLCPSGLLLYTL
jgi:hypothetical protein